MLYEEFLTKALAFDGVIFDCDGTLIDTMPLYYKGWQLCCADLGLKLSEEEFYSLGGMMVVGERRSSIVASIFVVPLIDKPLLS